MVKSTSDVVKTPYLRLAPPMPPLDELSEFSLADSTAMGWQGRVF